MPPKSPVRSLPAAPPLLSLLSSAEILREQDNRWEGGVAYEPEICGTDRTGAFAACDTSNMAAAPGSDLLEVEPIVIWAGDSCSPFGFASRDWQGRARRKLQACESNLIESELWRGEITRAQAGWTNRYLADNAATIVTGAAVSPLLALACLEQSLATCNCGAQGMIHATPQIITHWVSERLVAREGSKLFTELGTIVVPGSGYDGSGPAVVPSGPPVPAADGSIWAYATSMVHVRLGPAVTLPSETAQAMDRVSNTITYWAQRIYVAGWDCCHFASEIDLTLCETGS